MPTSVEMPALGESVTEGTVTQWLKNEGDTVEVDEPLLEVSTDKVDTEIPSPVSGVLSKILVDEDETVDIGAEIAIIGEPGESSPEAGASTAKDAQPEPEPAAEEVPAAAQPEPEPNPDPAKPEPEPEPEPAPAPQPARASREDSTPPVDVETISGTASSRGAADSGAGGGDAATEAYVTPLVRKLAAEHGVDLSSVRGTGVGGRIRKQDVQDAATAKDERSSAPAAPAAKAAPSAADAALRGRTEKMSRLRQTIADQMTESLRVGAGLTQVIEVDMTNIARLRGLAGGRFADREGVELGFFPFFALAATEALKANPTLNAVIDSEKSEVTYHDLENIAVSVDTERGLLAPVISDAGDLNLGGLARKIDDLTERAHTGTLNPDELAGGTFTLTDVGAVGALFDTPIINQPQVAILGTGAVVKRPIVVEDPELGEVIAVRSMAYLALTHDHRLIDSGDAGRFLQSVRERLEEGAFESDLGLS